MKNLKVGDKVRPKCLFTFTSDKLYDIDFVDEQTFELYDDDGLRNRFKIEEFNKFFTFAIPAPSTPKPTAVLVTTKREFDLLMGDYIKKGWSSANLSKYNPEYPIISIEDYFECYPEVVSYNFTLLPFSEYAKIAGIEVKEETIELSDGLKAKFMDGCVMFSTHRDLLCLLDLDMDKLYETYKLRKG